MTLVKSTALSLVVVSAPAVAFACGWMKQETATVATPIEIGSATLPNATPVDATALEVLPVVTPSVDVKDETTSAPAQ